MMTVNAVGNTLEFVGAPHVRGRLVDNTFHLDAGPIFAESVRRGLLLAPPVENPPPTPCDGVGVEGDEVLLIAHGWKQENYTIEDIGRCVEVWMPGTDWPAIIIGLLALAHPKPPTCESCGAPATCFGAYESSNNPESYACDSCCGHGQEDGHCEPVGRVTP